MQRPRIDIVTPVGPVVRGGGARWGRGGQQRPRIGITRSVCGRGRGRRVQPPRRPHRQRQRKKCQGLAAPVLGGIRRGHEGLVGLVRAQEMARGPRWARRTVAAAGLNGGGDARTEQEGAERQALRAPSVVGRARAARPRGGDGGSGRSVKAWRPPVLGEFAGATRGSLV